MADLTKLINQLTKQKKQISESILNEETKEPILKSIEQIIDNVHEVSTIDGVRKEVQNQIINPVAKLIKDGNRYKWLSIIASIGSLILAIFTVINTHIVQPKIVGQESRKVLAEYISIRNENGRSYYELNNKFGLLDEDGNKVTQAKYDEIHFCGMGTLSEVHVGNKEGVISNKGEIVIPIIYDDVNCQIDGTFKVRNNRKYGVVDFNNEIIVSMKYSMLSKSQYKPIYAVKFGQLYGIVDDKENVLIDFNYDFIRVPVNDYFIYNKNDIWGISTISKKKLFESEFEDMFVSGFWHTQLIGVTAQRNGKWGLLDVKGTELYPFKAVRPIEFHNNNETTRVMLPNNQSVVINVNGQVQ